MNYTINQAGRDDVMQDILQQFEAANESFADACRGEFDSRKWAWSGITYRQNGSVVGSPRDIVDTGSLRDSYRPDFQRSAGVYYHHWDAEHCVDVYRGRTTHTGAVHPARPWAKGPLQRFHEFL